MHVDNRSSTAHRLAVAYKKIALSNHYMVGLICNDLTFNHFLEAEQILIDWSNSQDNENPVIELALDLIEQEIRKRR